MRKRVLIVFFSWPLVIGVALMVFCKVTGASEQQAGRFVVLPIFLLVVLVLMTSSFTCPRCGKPFHRKGSYRNGFTRRCLNCGIEIGTPKNP